MASDAFGDFTVRKSEFDSLIASAMDSTEATAAAMYAKCAIVLACAALERFMNDVLEEVCRNFAEKSWEDLSAGRQRYLLRHLAIAMAEDAGRFTSKAQVDESDCNTLVKSVHACGRALDNPSTWTRFANFGMFGEGTSAPNKIDAVLKGFDANSRSIYQFIEDAGVELGRLTTGLQQLVEARHSAAHALKGAPHPGPSDAAEWVACAVTMAEKVDEFLDS